MRIQREVKILHVCVWTKKGLQKMPKTEKVDVKRDAFCSNYSGSEVHGHKKAKGIPAIFDRFASPCIAMCTFCLRKFGINGGPMCILAAFLPPMDFTSEAAKLGGLRLHNDSFRTPCILLKQ